MSEPGTELATIERTLRTDRDAYFADPGMRGRYSELLAERTTGAPAPVKGPLADELAAIARTRRENPAAYWSDNEMQVRERELLQAQIDGKPAPSLPTKSAGADEIALIDKTRREQPAKYWSDDQMQRRERELLAERHGLAEAEGEESWRSTPEDARQSLPPALVAEWDGARDFDGSLKRCQNATLLMLESIGDQENAESFLQSIYQFSESARTAFYREGALGAPTSVRPATEEAVASFQEFDGFYGAAFVERWGAEAPKRVAIFDARLDRLTASMLPADLKHFEQWFWECLSDRERSAIVWTLAH